MRKPLLIVVALCIVIAACGAQGDSTETGADSGAIANVDAQIVDDSGTAVPSDGATGDGSNDSASEFDTGDGGVVMPTEANTGPAAGTTFTDLDFSSLQPNTTYTARRLINLKDTDWPANVTLVDSIVTGSAGGVVCFNLQRVKWMGGIYIHQRPGLTCNGTIRQTSIINSKGQGFRPACTDALGNENKSGMSCTSGWKVEDSYIASPTPGDPGQHLEAMQSLWDTGGFTFRNVNFFMAGPANGTQTGDINWSGSNSTFTDCWFTGEAGYRIYAVGQNLSFVRPRIRTPAPTAYGDWYPDDQPANYPGVSVHCPMRTDNTPITTIAGSTCP